MMWATLETHPVPREWSPACFWPHPQCPPTGQLCEVPDSPDTLEAVTWRRSKSNHRGQTCASFFFIIILYWSYQRDSLPRPTFPMCAGCGDVPSYAFSSLSLISSETEGICLLLFALGLCKGSLAGEHAYDFLK